MSGKYKRVVAEVLSISGSGSNLIVELEFQESKFLGRSSLVTRLFQARGSVARALPHWIYVGGRFDFQVDVEMTEIIGISEVR